MLFAVIGISAGKTRDEIMAIFPRHKAFLDQFLAHQTDNRRWYRLTNMLFCFYM